MRLQRQRRQNHVHSKNVHVTDGGTRQIVHSSQLVLRYVRA